MERTDIMVYRVAGHSFAQGEQTDAWEVAQQTGLTELEAVGSLDSLCWHGYLEMARGSVVGMPLPLYHDFVEHSE